MRRAIDETDRRRQKQEEYNQQHGITPVGIKKKVSDIMESSQLQRKGGQRRGALKVAEQRPNYDVDELATEDVWKLIAQLEDRMFQHAKDLEFEDAAKIRDRIAQLKLQT